MKLVTWLLILTAGLAAPANARQSAFEGEWLQEHLPYESEAGKTKLFVNAEHTAKTGTTARARLLLVDEVPAAQVGWQMLDLTFDCSRETMRLVTQRAYDPLGRFLGQQAGAGDEQSVGEPGDLWRVVFDFACHGKNTSLSPIIGDVRDHAKGAFAKPAKNDPWEGAFD